ncbi:recombinase family protein [Acinetobacter bereziniae]|uniref:Recombinase family protein n=3 Tax=Acinetobacter bereziniae TaxID=106648 RepID=A0A8I1AGE1_ACIBZ|nr:recombinase family protein [Acinetobacter bereziniae]MBJ9947979.1 recombinase family protein [Acinetobacter bereziniae]QQC86045.1 recombinase family protein [Acinetobacter bereziniae]UUN99267.1 recombinase family protein [Acinetobacter bereziniae]
MRAYAYFRTDEVSKEDFNYVDYLKKYGYEIPKNRFIFEQVKIGIPLKFRQKLIILINYTLESGDLLIIDGIDSLGSDFKEIYSNVSTIFKKGIRLVCLEFSKKEIKGDVKKIFFHFLKMCSDFDRKVKLEKMGGRKKINKIGRPEILTKKKKKEIIEKFKNGQSVYALARQYAVARSVIQRLLSQATENIIYED